MLIDDVKVICDRLGPLGWSSLLSAVTKKSLNISQKSASDLKAALLQPLTAINRTFPGFEDFSSSARQAITPGLPEQSLLYHALANPLVLADDQGEPLRGFPSLRELETIENFVFASKQMSFKSLKSDIAKGSEIGLVVFAYEYRPVAGTVSQTNAKLLFSRTGVARVGTIPPLYDGTVRGFWPEDQDNVHAVRVSPARYGAFLSTKRKIPDAVVMPILLDDDNSGDDSRREFWIPVHKVFSGDECLTDLKLEVTFSSFHHNEKIFRVHKSLGENPPAEAPYSFSQGIAELSSDQLFGQGVVVPVVHPRLVEPAMFEGEPLTYRVPPQPAEVFAAYEPKNPDDQGDLEINRFPSYVHARLKIANGLQQDLNEQEDVLGAVREGNYDALHFLDFTGEGYVQVSCRGLSNPEVNTLPAYSLVAAPDPFPACGQNELSRWGKSSNIPVSLRKSVWGVPPTALCEIRFPANLQLPNTPFEAADDTITAIVEMSPGKASSAFALGPQILRSTHLPDDAAGVFAPGWDVSMDLFEANGTSQPHLAAYGLGSPFPEDSKLCAALSSFWPAVAPDVWRTMSPHTGNAALKGTITPLTDEEIGQTGTLPWDGVNGPTIIQKDGQRLVEIASFLNVDYVQEALENRFSFRLTSRVTAQEYMRRTLGMLFVHKQIAGVGDPAVIRPFWLVLSFRAIQHGEPELQQAQSQAGAILAGAVYRVDMMKLGPTPQIETDPSKPRRRLIPVQDRRFFFVDPDHQLVLHKRENQSTWSKWQFGSNIV
jgi:hypothetical protein